MQVDLFGNTVVPEIRTEGIKYAGSKLKIIPHILESIKDLDVNTVFDGFSGTTRVSQGLAQAGYSVTANDISHWSEVFGTCYLLGRASSTDFGQLIDHLNSLTPQDGWFTQHYGGCTESGTKKPFQVKNTRKLDAIRDEIDRLALSDIDRSVALTSLIMALDKVDSTLGHYVSYLSEWSPRSYNDLELKVPRMIKYSGEHLVLRGDVFDALGGGQFDLCYFDPPYGSNNDKMPPSRVRYASYYHIWTTVIRNDRPELFGKVNRREDSRDKVAGSVFEEFRKDEDGHFIAMKAIERMITEARCRYVLLSYSSGGRATKQQLLDVLSSSGRMIKALEIDYRHNVMGSMRWTNEWINSDNKHKEYLFLVEKG